MKNIPSNFRSPELHMYLNAATCWIGASQKPYHYVSVMNSGIILWIRDSEI